jgi:hypothetical protein
MTHVMCNPWKRTFTLVPLIPLILISPLCEYKKSTKWPKEIVMFFLTTLKIKFYYFQKFHMVFNIIKCMQ